MANTEQLQRLRASVKERNRCQAWNQWRREENWQSWIDLSDEDFRYVCFMGADLRRANFREAYLNDADLRQADLTRADLTGASLWRARLGNAHLSGADLMSADLMSADLTGANLSRARLSHARLRGAHLNSGDLRQADLRSADLSHADLRNAHLNNADLRQADLRSANLYNVDLTDADLTGADLSNVFLEGVNLQGCQMCEVRLGAPVHGEPIWPEMEASVWDALQDEARSPTTPAVRLAELATHWLGYQVRHLLVANPNLPQEQVIALAWQFPRAFLTNPALPLWFVADPNWLPPYIARDVLGQGQQEPDWPALAEQHAALVALLERCAGQKEQA